MARYAFDLDGTIDASPELAHLARALGRDGHKTLVITGSDYSKKELKAKVYSLNLEWIWKIVKVKKKGRELTEFQVGILKGNIANKNKVSLYFDGDESVLDGFGQVSKIPRLHLLPRAHKDSDAPSVDNAPKKRSADFDFDDDDYEEYDVRWLDCPCDTTEFRASRCYHCPDFLQSDSQRSAHARKHHSVSD